MIIDGVRFRLATVVWEDAVGRSNWPAPDIKTMTEGTEWVGAVNETTGNVAVVGGYTIIITRYDANDNVYDYTLIPFTKTKIEYHRKKRLTT